MSCVLNKIIIGSLQDFLHSFILLHHTRDAQRKKNEEAKNILTSFNRSIRNKKKLLFLKKEQW